MAVEQPPAFALTLEGADGPYEARFEPTDDEDQITVCGLGAEPLIWHVDVCERRDEGWELGGLSRGTQHVWGDVYWFTLYAKSPVRMEYWGAQVLIRTDVAIA